MGSGEHVPGDWSTARPNGGQQQGGRGGLWDDAVAAGSSSGEGGGGMDLSDFAAMSQKFRSEMEEMKLAGDAGAEARGEDTMERLFRDQQDRSGGGGLEDDEDEALPDWADDDALTSSASAAAPAVAPAAKRSLLLDVRHFPCCSDYQIVLPTSLTQL